LKTKYLKEWESGLIHGNRRRKPQNAMPEELRGRAARLYEEGISSNTLLFLPFPSLL
jgi:hypothetical protein